MSGNYDKFLAVLKKWPVNANRRNRDFGTHLRDLLKNRNFLEEIFAGNSSENLKKIESLMRLSENKYGNQYPNHYKVGATGLPLKDLHDALSDKYVKLLSVKCELTNDGRMQRRKSHMKTDDLFDNIVSIISKVYSDTLRYDCPDIRLFEIRHEIFDHFLLRYTTKNLRYDSVILATKKHNMKVMISPSDD